MSLKVETDSPIHLWVSLNQSFIGKYALDYVDENTGISVQSFDNHFSIRDWDTEDAGPKLQSLLKKMGYSVGGTKMTQLFNKYVDLTQYKALKLALKDYRDKDRFTLGMTFKNSPARSGGCLTGLQIVRYKKMERAFVYAKIVEIPKKFAADLLFFNTIFDGLSFSGPVIIIPTCIFFWKVTAPLLVPVLGLDAFKYEPFRSHVIKKIKNRKHLASAEYAYRNEARTWEYLKPIIDEMIEEGEIDV